MTETKKYQGVIVPMVTPFTANGNIDHSATKRITDYLVNGGVSPFVLGTTGESASIPASAKADFVETVVKQAAGRTMTYAGISGNCLEASIEAAKKYFDFGVSAVVAHLPSYYPLTADHMLRYYETLAERIPGPLILYNIPITTHMSIPLDVVEKLSHHPNIVGLKDSEGKVERLEQAVEIFKDRDDFSHLTGNSSLSAKALLMGSDGIVPSGGNFVPMMYRKLYEAAIKDDVETANRLQKQTNEVSQIYLNDRLLVQSLAALKAIMSELGLCGPTVLPPLFHVGTEEKADIKEKMAVLNLSEQTVMQNK